MVKSNHRTRKDKSARPEKPDKHFPLFPHATRRWAKKIWGKMHYFGPWEDPQGALDRYLAQKDDLHAGRVPQSTGDGLTVGDLVNRYLTKKKRRMETGELKPESFAENYAACERVVGAFGRNRLVADLRPEDFERLEYRFPKKWGPHKRGKVVQLIRSAFNYAWNQNLIDKPVKFGDFKKPGQKVFRLHRAGKKTQNGKRMFSAAELRRILAAAAFLSVLWILSRAGWTTLGRRRAFPGAVPCGPKQLSRSRKQSPVVRRRRIPNMATACS
jgi:hypothetical protein